MGLEFLIDRPDQGIQNALKNECCANFLTVTQIPGCTHGQLYRNLEIAIWDPEIASLYGARLYLKI